MSLQGEWRTCAQGHRGASEDQLAGGSLRLPGVLWRGRRKQVVAVRSPAPMTVVTCPATTGALLIKPQLSTPVRNPSQRMRSWKYPTTIFPIPF